MEKDEERSFLDTFTRALLSLPFDIKALVDAVADPDLDPATQELAAATVIHVLTPKDGHFDAYLRHAEDVILVRLALRRIVSSGDEAAAAFRERYAETFEHLEQEIEAFEGGLGSDLVQWLDGRWDALKKTPHGKKTAAQFVKDESLSNSLYDDAMQFVTDYPVTEQSIEGRIKQAQPLVEHLARKRDLDKMKIGH